MILPKEVLEIIDRHATEGTASTIKNEISKATDFLPFSIQVTSSIESGATKGDWFLNHDGNELRPNTLLSWSIIDSMEKSAMISFAILMKLAPILSVFRSWQGILIKSPDEDLAEVVSENLRQVLPIMAMDFGYRSMIDGTCFMETLWENTTKYKLGLAPNKLPSKLYTVAKTPHIVDPRTVLEIVRAKTGNKFNGFIQESPTEPYKKIVVKRDQALVIPNNERFRNLWGVSSLEPLYRPWFWFQVVLRSIVRWAERMAVPTAIGEAPMMETIIDPNDSKRNIKALDYAASLAASLARSSSAAIPSDVDPETGKRLYDLRYLSASDSGVSATLLQILQEFAQLIIRGAISADRATTQSSGGVGSKNIGEVHNQATQYHNQMILTRWLSYLNKYYLPWFSAYNRGVNGPPIRTEVATVDPVFQGMLAQIMGTMGNSKPGQDALWEVDYTALLNLAHVPTIDPEEAEEKRERSEEEAAKKADEAMMRQQKMPPPPEAAEARKSQVANEKKMEKVEAAAAALAKILDSGGKAPAFADADQVLELIKEFKKPIVLQEPDFDESKVSRDAGGRFASKAEKAQGKQGPEFIGDKENAKKLLSQYGLSEEQIAEALKIIEASKPYDSLEDAFQDISNFLVENGFGDKEDIEKASVAVFEDLARGIGYYNFAGDKKIAIEEGLKQAILSGNPMGINALMHEILHASGEDIKPGTFTPQNAFQVNALEAGYPTRANNMDELSQAIPALEGKNELANLIALNDFYGTEGLTLNDDSYRAAIHALYGDVDHYDQTRDIQPYSTSIVVASQVALAVQKLRGVSPEEWTVSSNKMGLNTIAAEDELRILFPARMEDYGTQDNGAWTFPSQDQVSRWATEDYEIAPEGAVEDVIGGN